MTFHCAGPPWRQFSHSLPHRRLQRDELEMQVDRTTRARKATRGVVAPCAQCLSTTKICHCRGGTSKQALADSFEKTESLYLCGSGRGADGSDSDEPSCQDRMQDCICGTLIPLERRSSLPQPRALEDRSPQSDGKS